MKLSKALVAILLTIPLFAEAYELKPYMGIDFQNRNMEYVEGFGDNLFKKHYPQGNLYAGIKLNDYFGLEFGYESSPMRTKSSTVNPGELSLGLDAHLPPERHITKSKIKGWHTGVMGYLPIGEQLGGKVDLLWYVGMIKLKVFNQDLFAANSSGPLNIFSTSRTFVMRKSALKLGVGAQYNMKNIGFRVMAGYENTNLFRRIPSQEKAASKKRLGLKDSYILGVGVFITTP